MINKKVILSLFFSANLIFTFAQTNSNDPTNKPVEKASFIIKTAPFDFIINRFIVAGEYQWNKKSSVELSLAYDYLKQTDLIYGNVSDFGQYYYIASRYKFFPNWGQHFIAEHKRNQMNGFYLAAGLELGQSPLLYGPNESVFTYVSDTPDERSNFFGANADVGYSWIIKRWNIETFVGFNARQNSHAQSSMLVGEELVFDYAPLFSSSGRIGIRVGYVIF